MVIRLAKTQVEPEEPILVNPPDELETIMLQLRRAKANEAQTKLAIIELERRYIELAGDQKTVRRGGIQATVVRRETTRIDEAKLEKVLGPKWDHVTKTVFDKAKLESAISLGIVSIEQVSEASQIVPAKPYVRVSEVVDDSES